MKVSNDLSPSSSEGGDFCRVQEAIPALRTEATLIAIIRTSTKLAKARDGVSSLLNTAVRHDHFRPVGDAVRLSCPYVTLPVSTASSVRLTKKSSMDLETLMGQSMLWRCGHLWPLRCLELGYCELEGPEPLFEVTVMPDQDRPSDEEPGGPVSKLND